MGLKNRKSKSTRGQRREPQLFADGGRSSSREKSPRRRQSFVGFLFGLAIKGTLLGTVIVALGLTYVWMSLNRQGMLQIPQAEPGIMMLADDGTQLSERGSFFGDQVDVADLPDYMAEALIAIEDRRFRSHFGVDPVGLARAVVQNVTRGSFVQGGSTLTQQLAKNLFLTPERTLKRKIQEMVLAIWLEQKFTKDQILQLYLNRVYFRPDMPGIEIAAQTFFHKPATELTLTEAATLAGVLKAPTTYNPLTHPVESATRTKLVLDAMEDVGFITPEQKQQAITAPTTVVASDYVPATQYVIDWVSAQLPQLVKNYDQSIVVETTISSPLQEAAEASVRKHLSNEGKKLRASQGAMVVLDSQGAVKALVGGRSYKKSQYNRATKALRQPGSAFKPFVYLAAMEHGYTPRSVEIDEPVRIGNWEPENYKHKYLGQVTLRQALAQSLNTVAAKLAVSVGPDNVVSVAHRLGITSNLGNDASIALGTSEVTLLDLTSAFAPFANGGYTAAPYVVKRITTRDGQVLYERKGDGFGQSINPQNLGQMNNMLRAVVTEGTARSAQLKDFDVAGKTGTSQDYRDAWFIGYSTYYVGGVWVGNDDNSPTKNVTGGSIPASIWKDVMLVAHNGLAPEPLPGDDGDDFELAPYVASAESQQDSIYNDASVQQAEAPRRKKETGFLESIFGSSKSANRKKITSPDDQLMPEKKH